MKNVCTEVFGKGSQIGYAWYWTCTILKYPVLAKAQLHVLHDVGNGGWFKGSNYGYKLWMRHIKVDWHGK